MTDLADPIRCAKCGYGNPELREGALVVWFNDTDVSLMLAFFEGGPALHCVTCEYQLAAVPTIIFNATAAKKAFLLIGTQSETAADEIMAGIAARRPEAPVERLASAEELRAAIVQHTREQVLVYSTVMRNSVGGGNDASFLPPEWRRLTSSVFAALMVALRTPSLPTMVLAPKENGAPTADDVIASVAAVQARVWVMLVLYWTAMRPAPTIEDDLRQYIVPGVFFPGAADESLKMLDEYLERRGKDLPSRYIVLAVRTSICNAADVPDSRAAEWAEAYFGFEVAFRQLEANGNVSGASLRIATERARRTIAYQGAWNATEHVIAQGNGERLLMLLDITTSLGFPMLVAEVIASAPASFAAAWTVDDARTFVRTLAADGFGAGMATLTLRAHLRPWVFAKRMDELEAVADELVAQFGNDPLERADIETWFGRCCKEAEHPERFFARVGDVPQEWERTLPPLPAVRLLTERSNNDRLRGRLADALATIEEVLRIYPAEGGEDNRRVALRNRAVMLRESGRLDESVTLLEDVLSSSVGAERIETLRSLVIGYRTVKRYDDAVAAAEEAWKLASGPFASYAAQATAMLAQMKVLNGATDAARELLEPLDPLALDSVALAASASAWINVVRKLDGEARAAVEARTTTWINVLEMRAAEAAHAATVPLEISLRELIGFLSIEIRRPDAAAILRATLDLCIAQRQSPSVSLLLTFAGLSIADDDRTEACRLLRMVPDAMATEAGLTDDLLAVAGAQEHVLRGNLHWLADAIDPTGEHPADMRIVAELQRDVVGRSQCLRQARSTEAAVRLDAVLSGASHQPVVTTGQTTAVIEFVAGTRGMATLLTLVGPDGNATVTYFPPTPFSLPDLGAKMQARLAAVRPGANSDPFDDPEWRTLEEWFDSAARSRIPDDAHLVFIEHEWHEALPWHVAARRWTTSYARSWSSMLLHEAAPAEAKSLGVIFVPQRDESPRVTNALGRSRDAARSLAETCGFDLVECVDPASCDEDEAREIMLRSSVLKLLCHGYVDYEQREVALVLAHGDHLPLPAAALSRPNGRRFRAGWRQLSTMSSAPPAVFSAACSSGYSHVAGLGERVGLFTGLQRAGTRTLVAPRWALYASSVLPILDHVMDMVLGERKLPVAMAVREACTTAETTHSRWLAWTLAIEGEWR